MGKERNLINFSSLELFPEVWGQRTIFCWHTFSAGKAFKQLSLLSGFLFMALDRESLECVVCSGTVFPGSSYSGQPGSSWIPSAEASEQRVKEPAVPAEKRGSQDTK